ncbi:SH3 and multiple ankyrin repeat domains protein 3-like [Liolophura sinensis]|uniref:SH3 and multiple ankyrin repeat domains protein 3-like n=1 Tax=Liolophura sinensis TaxID=3198878 RepID=UPI003158B34E
MKLKLWNYGRVGYLCYHHSFKLSVISVGLFDGKLGAKEGWPPSNHGNKLLISKTRSGSLGDLGEALNMDRNTLAALVEARDGPRTVLLQKGREGFGFVLRGAKSKHMPVSSLDFHPTAEYPALQYLDSVDPGSMAEKAGLNSGDFILEINGHNVVQASHERVVELIKASGDTLKLKVVTVRPQEKNWFVHQDGCMTLPTRGKGKAPQPPKRNPNTSLSYSKARSKSFAEGLAEIEKLDETLAQYDAAGSRSMTGLDRVGSTEGDTKIASIRTRHAAKRVSCIQFDGEYGSASEKKTTPPVLPKKYASPSELRIQRYHKKYQQGTLEKARSTPNLANGDDGKEVIYATPHVQAGNGPLTQNGANKHFSSNGYKTVLSIGSGDSDSSTSSDSVSGIARGKAKQNIYSVPHTAPKVTSLRAASHGQIASNISQGVATGNNLRSHGPKVDRPQKPVSVASMSGVLIPPPPRKPAPQPPVKSEVVCISTNSSIYANVSAEIQARKTNNADSPYESSFRPGTNAKVTKDPDVTTASVEQAKLRVQRKGSIGSLQHAQHLMSAEDKQKFLSFPRHGHPPAELEKPTSNEGPRTVSFADDRVFENAASFMEHHPNASLLVTANMGSSERQRLSKDLYEPEPDYDADSDDGDVVVPKPTAPENNTSRRSSSSSASSVSNRSDIPVSIHTQTRPLGSSGMDANTSVTVISVGNESPKLQPASQTKSDSIPHYSVNSNIPKHASDSKENISSRQVKDNADTSDTPSLLTNQIRLAALARDKRREEQNNRPTSAAMPPPPPAPAIPPAPSPPAPAVPSQETVSRSCPSTMPSRPSAEEIQIAAAERQTRLQNGGAEHLLNRPVAVDSTRKKPLDQTQAAILAAVAKRRSVLEQSPEKDIVNQIESKLNKTKKLQSVKYYGSGSQPQTQAEKKPITATPKTAEKPTGKASPKPSTVKETPVTKNSPRTVQTATDSQKPQATSANSGSNFLALAEKARQEYLQKKNNESGKKDIASHPLSKTPPPPPVKSVFSKGQSSAKTNSSLKASGEVNSRPGQGSVENTSDTNSDENKSIQDKIKSFEKKLDFSSIIRNNNSGYEVRGVTEDDSHTEADNRSAGQLPSAMVAPPPAFSDHGNVVSEDVVEIEIIPPPSTFAGEDHAGSPDQTGNSAFGHDDSVSLHSSVSTLSTLSSEHGEGAARGQPISALEEVIAPPPPGFGDSQDHYIPPPPEFQESNSSSKVQSKPFSSKAVDLWNCVDVLDWLESLNMLQYRSSFASHSIDGKRLVELSRNDYIELGVTQVGHRMNIERSIKKLALQKSAVY